MVLFKRGENGGKNHTAVAEVVIVLMEGAHEVVVLFNWSVYLVHFYILLWLLFPLILSLKWTKKNRKQNKTNNRNINLFNRKSVIFFVHLNTTPNNVHFNAYAHHIEIIIIGFDFFPIAFLFYTRSFSFTLNCTICVALRCYLLLLLLTL